MESNQNIMKNAKEILANDDKLSEFAQASGVSEETAKGLLKRLLEKPEISEEIKAYLDSSDADHLKDFRSGEEEGYKRGHESGFGKGVALAFLTFTTAAIALLTAKK